MSIAAQSGQRCVVMAPNVESTRFYNEHPANDTRTQVSKRRIMVTEVERSLIRTSARALIVFCLALLAGPVLAATVPRTLVVTIPPMPANPSAGASTVLIGSIQASGSLCFKSMQLSSRPNPYACSATTNNRCDTEFFVYLFREFTWPHWSNPDQRVICYEAVRVTNRFGVVGCDGSYGKAANFVPQTLTVEFTDTPLPGCTPSPALSLFAPVNGSGRQPSQLVPVSGQVESQLAVTSVQIRPRPGASGSPTSFGVSKSGNTYSFSGNYLLQSGENPLEFVVSTACGPSQPMNAMNLKFGPVIDPDVRNDPNCPVECDETWPDGRVEASGNLMVDPPDVTLPGSTPVSFERFYNSADRVKGPFGLGWTHKYNIQAIRVRNPDNGERRTIVRWSDGSRLQFVEGPGGALTGPPGFILVSASNATGRLILETPNKIIYTFDADGFIEQIQYEHGRSLTFRYDSEHHRLKSITTEAGLQLDLHYKDKSDPTNFKLDYALATTGEKAQYNYSSEKQLSDATDAAGATNSYAYAANTRLTSITDSKLGPIMEAKYDSMGRVSEYSVKGVVGASTTKFTYDPTGKKTTAKYADNTLKVQGYDAHQQPTAVTDPAGGTKIFSVNAHLQVTSVVDAIGRQTKFSYSPEGHVTSVQAADGTSTAITLTKIQGVERPTEIRSPSGGLTKIDYDPATGLPLLQTDPTGKATAFEHDANGRTTRVTRGSNLVMATEYTDHGVAKKVSVTTLDAGGTPRTATTEIEYDAALHPVKVTDPERNVTQTEFDARGRPRIVVDAAGGITTYTRDSRGNVIETEDARGHKTYAKFDSVGRLEWQENNKHNRTTTNTYDPKRGFLLSKTNFRSEVTQWQYDKAGRVTRTINPENTFTSTTYDPAGQVTTVTNARGYITRFGYDSVGRLVVTTNPDGTEERRAYNGDGHLTSVRDSAGRITTYVVDGAGRVTETHLPDGQSITKTFYDADGRPVEELDPLNRKTKTEYDDLGRAFRTTVAADSPEKITYTTKFDRAGRVTEIVTGKESSWKYTYDGVGRKTSETDPLGNTRSWKYDKVGNVQEVTEPDAAGPIVTSLEYDELNRPNLIVRPDERVTIEYFDTENRTKSVITRSGVDLVIERTYDKLSRLKIEKVGDKTVTFDYDENSNVKTLRLGAEDRVKYEYDNRDRCRKITDVRASRVVEMTYNAAGEMTSLTYPSGVKKVLTYGARGETKTISYLTAQDAPIRTISYEYDKALRLLSKTESPGASTEFEYDAHARLTKAIYPDGAVEEFAYDAAGNIKTYTSPTGVESRTYDSADQILMSSGSRRAWYEFNKRGQLVKITTPGTIGSNSRNIRFDSFGRVLTVDDDGSAVLSAAYKDNYELYATRSGGDPATDTMYSWGLGNIFTEFNSLGSEQNFVLHALGMDNPVEQGRPDGGGRETLLTDLLQTALAGTDDAGAIVGTEVRAVQHFAFGAVKAGTDSGPVGFHGARKLGSTGLVYLRNRIYDPALGRFLSRDPLGFRGGRNVYAYGENSPQRFRDPTGLTVWTNVAFVIQFLTGTGANVQTYTRGTEFDEVMASQGVYEMKRKWFSVPRPPGSTMDFEYTTSHAAKETLLHPTMWGGTDFQLGGWIGSGEAKADGTVAFKIVNTAGAHSFFYHLPFVSDRTGMTGPFRTIIQYFEWTEQNGPSPYKGYPSTHGEDYAPIWPASWPGGSGCVRPGVP